MLWRGSFFEGFSDKCVSTLGCCRAAASFIYLSLYFTGTTGAQTLPLVLCRLLVCRASEAGTNPCTCLGRCRDLQRSLAEASVLSKAGTSATSCDSVFTDLGVSSRGIKSDVFSCERTSPSAHLPGGSCRGLAAACPSLLALTSSAEPIAHSRPGVHMNVPVAQTSKQPSGAPAVPNPEPLQSWAPHAKQ